MKKILIGLLMIFFFLVDYSIKAEKSDEGFEKFLSEVGYKEISIAHQDCEKHFNRSLALPTQLPPVSFTHSFGRLNNLEGKENDDLEVVYINFDSPQNHYNIQVKPVEHGLSFTEKDIDQRFPLKDGKDALFIHKKVLGFHLLIFEKAGWQHMLSVDKRIADTVTPEVLVNIANSVGKE